MKDFGKRLKELRLEKNLSSIDLAKELDVSDTTILRWEKEIIMPAIDKLYKIAVFFGVSADYLLGLKDY